MTIVLLEGIVKFKTQLTSLDMETVMLVKARPRSNCKLQAHPIMREDAP
jgi:hypothetical protein